ncbi:hypothetical protein COCMIDRAFT_24949 [Bipolaris oryzae ATCC 44560]|uniref:Uncharacterized protein n=1 Tax=Bipolaris oryzae ATCC 44560 TaxID=930090 RepID=W6ZII7_COCMI|nr:uncharacterized protein COCMIDRAFT_24949 [Bipolaris oryzae ATCC 44560]EUC47184.1 hypothetical protein COCMIDRAFT_24949 [Bipolaris oryzae ATCC 44560]
MLVGARREIKPGRFRRRERVRSRRKGACIFPTGLKTEMEGRPARVRPCAPSPCLAGEMHTLAPGVVERQHLHSAPTRWQYGSAAWSGALWFHAAVSMCGACPSRRIVVWRWRLVFFYAKRQKPKAKRWPRSLAGRDDSVGHGSGGMWSRCAATRHDFIQQRCMGRAGQGRTGQGKARHVVDQQTQ